MDYFAKLFQIIFVHKIMELILLLALCLFPLLILSHHHMYGDVPLILFSPHFQTTTSSQFIKLFCFENKIKTEIQKKK
jgi:hypothetical protein